MRLAGGSGDGHRLLPVWSITTEEFRRVTEITYLGAVHGTMAALRHEPPRLDLLSLIAVSCYRQLTAAPSTQSTVLRICSAQS